MTKRQTFGTRVLPAVAACAALTAIVPAAHAETLRVWTRSNVDARATYDNIAAAFTKKTGIKVEYFNAMTDYEQRLSRAIAGNDLPDVIINDTSSLGLMMKSGVAQEIDRASLPGANEIQDRAWDGARGYNGKYYGVPVSVQSFVFLIRKDWRDKLGLPVPKSWEDIAALAKAFTTKQPAGPGKQVYGFAFPGSATRGYTTWFMSSFLWQAGGDFIRPVSGGKFRGSLDEPAAVKTVGYFRQMMCTDKVMQPGAINATTADAIASFRSGQTGIFFTGPYHIAVADQEPGRDKIEVVAAPPGPAGKSDSLGEGELAYVTRAANKQAALSFIAFLTSGEGQRMGMNPGGFPVVRLPVNKTVNSGQVYKDQRWVTVENVYQKDAHYVPAIPDWMSMRQLTAEGLNRILANCSSDVDGGLKDLNKRVNQELARQRVLAN
ncbi:ABC transporter substrate-binding protein [Cupriavidus basilensis]|uniref:Sugar ABC transporter substrate-binding protein n=1 Tax=Cupriavidus basilensis TaxID=68895 RepID=A0A643FYM9_9BURK|nr:sugar ABC transporter substrate-binding protein [Cupriavidus basilensis]QOT82113.1 sugar ABC transporter substrate-binding protein [Cupriavidus basilensis]